MKIIDTGIQDLILIEPTIYGDERGYFFESFNQKTWEDNIGKIPHFVQDNESMSQKNVLRGLHFQKPPFAQAKLIRVVKGRVLDVAVDLRKNSPTYGKSFVIDISAENKRQLFIPEGFAHGFLTLEENTIFSYKCTNFYHKESEDGLAWNDDSLAIDWGGIIDPVLSDKDKDYKNFSNFTTPFN